MDARWARPRFRARARAPGRLLDLADRLLQPAGGDPQDVLDRPSVTQFLVIPGLSLPGDDCALSGPPKTPDNSAL